jgi:PAS domain
MRHPSIRMIHHYWNQLRGARLAPSRDEIDPRAMAPHLCDLLLLEGVSAEFRFRLAGSRIIEVLNRSLTHQPFHSLWTPESRPEAKQLAQITANDAEPVLLGTRLVSGDTPARYFSRHDPVPNATERRLGYRGNGELLLLPLFHEGKLGAQMMGAFALTERTNNASLERRLDTEPAPLRLRETPPPTAETRNWLAITGMRALKAQPRAGNPLGLMDASLADQVVSTHGHLVLLRGGRT